MDSLKIAASKVKKSPKALKVKIDNAFNKESKKFDPFPKKKTFFYKIPQNLMSHSSDKS